MNFAELDQEELATDEQWQLAKQNHPGCLLDLGYFACKAMGWDFPTECPCCKKPIPGDPPN